MHETEVECPFCGETFTTLVDCSPAHRPDGDATQYEDGEQSYIEDCFVCCRPIRFTARCSEGELLSLEVSRE